MWIFVKVQADEVVSCGFFGACILRCWGGWVEELDVEAPVSENLVGTSSVQYLFCSFCTANMALGG